MWDLQQSDLFSVDASESPWSAFLPSMRIGDMVHVKFAGDLIPQELSSPNEIIALENMTLAIRPVAIASPTGETLGDVLKRAEFYKTVANEMYKSKEALSDAVALYRAAEMICYAGATCGAVSPALEGETDVERSLRMLYHTVLANICACYIKLMNHEKALEYCDWLLELSDIDNNLLHKTYYRKAQTLSQCCKTDEALVVLTTATDANPDAKQLSDLHILIKDIVCNKVRMLMQGGDHEKAIVFLKSTGVKYPACAEAFEPLLARARASIQKVKPIYRKMFNGNAKGAQHPPPPPLKEYVPSPEFEDSQDNLIAIKPSIWDSWEPTSPDDDETTINTEVEQLKSDGQQSSQEINSLTDKLFDTQPFETHKRPTLEELPPLDELIRNLDIADTHKDILRGFSTLTMYDYRSLLRWIQVNPQFRPYLNADATLVGGLVRDVVTRLAEQNIVMLYRQNVRGHTPMYLSEQLTPWNVAEFEDAKFVAQLDPKRTSLTDKRIDQLLPPTLDDASLEPHLAVLPLVEFRQALTKHYHAYQSYQLQKVQNWLVNSFEGPWCALWSDKVPKTQQIAIVTAYLSRLAKSGAVEVLEPKNSEKTKIWIKPCSNDDQFLDFHNHRANEMDKYRKQPAAEITPQPPKQKGDICVNAGGKIRTYVAAALKALQIDSEHGCVSIYGEGAAINKAVSVVEIIKRNMKYMVHQYNTIGSVDETDVWDPVSSEKDIDSLAFTRHLPFVSITLSQEKLDGMIFQGSVYYFTIKCLDNNANIYDLDTRRLADQASRDTI